MALKRSTGLRNRHLSLTSLKEAFKDYIITIYSGTVPSSADDAAGTVIARITLDGEDYATPVAQVSTLTITRANNGTHIVTINGIKFTYVAGGASVATDDVADSLVYMINAACNTATFPLVNGTMVIGQGTDAYNPLTGLLTAVKSSSTLVTLTSAVGKSFDLTASGATGGNTVAALVTPASPGLLFEAYADTDDGILEKNSSQVWSGVGLSNGTATYARIHSTSDTNASDVVAAYSRLQCSIGTSNADIIASSVAVKTGVTLTVDQFSITLPESA